MSDIMRPMSFGQIMTRAMEEFLRIAVGDDMYEATRARTEKENAGAGAEADGVTDGV